MIDRISKVLLIIGGLIWGMVGVADFNPIMWIFVGMRTLHHVIYILIGLSAIWQIYRSVSRRGRPQ